MIRRKLRPLGLSGAVMTLLLLFQNCGELSYVAPKNSGSDASTMPAPAGTDPVPAPSSLLAVSLNGASAASAPVSGTIQITGSASSKWTKITVSDVSQPALSVSTSPANGSYSVQFDTTMMSNGIGRLAVIATADSGEQKEVDLPLIVNNAGEALSLVAVNAGGPAFSGFAADTGFTGGTTVEVVSYLVGFMGSARYDTARVGNFSYKVTGFPPNTHLMVAFSFAEIAGATPGQRTFDVTINGGAAVLSSFDIVTAAGASYSAIERQFPFTTDTEGNAVFQFTGVKGPALLNAFEVYAP